MGTTRGRRGRRSSRSSSWRWCCWLSPACTPRSGQTWSSPARTAGRHRHRAALLAWVFPLVMVADVLATGNHYVLDVVGSAVLLGASIAVARLVSTLAARRQRMTGGVRSAAEGPRPRSAR